MDKELIIYGTGRYGERIFKYLKGIGFEAKAFSRTKVVSGELFLNIPVISPKDIDYDNSVIIVAVQNNCVVREITDELIKNGQPSSSIINGSSFLKWHLPLDGAFVSEEGYFCTICNKRSSNYLPIVSVSELFNSRHVIGGGSREHCYCPVCGSSDRERWQKIVLDRYTDIFTQSCRVLHIAPESSIEPLIRHNPYCDYYAGDLEPGKAVNVVDVTKIQFLDGTFDYIIMNHVLEHIPNESDCMNELRRVLKDDGTLIMSFPICIDVETDDDPMVKTESERLKRFGQKDHVRLYGYDYKERIEKYGFKIDVITAKDYPELVVKHGLIPDDIIMLARKGLSI